MRLRLFLFLFFYVLSFPAQRPTDLLAVGMIALLLVVRGYRHVVKAALAVIDEAHSDKVDTFITRKWKQYCLGGFTKDMTTSLAHCLFAMFCVKYGFDALHAGAMQVPPLQRYAEWLLYVGGIILFVLAGHRGISLWLELRARIRNGESQARPKLMRFLRMFLKPVVACALILYASDILKLSAATIAKGGWHLSSVASGQDAR